MFSTAASFVRAHLEFCTPRDQTQLFLLFQRRDLCRPYIVFETDKFFTLIRGRYEVLHGQVLAAATYEVLKQLKKHNFRSAKKNFPFCQNTCCSSSSVYSILWP